MLHCLGLHRPGDEGKKKKIWVSPNYDELLYSHDEEKFQSLLNSKNPSKEFGAENQKEIANLLSEVSESFYQDIILQRLNQVLVSFCLLGQSLEVLTNMMCFEHMNWAELTLWNVHTWQKGL